MSINKKVLLSATAVLSMSVSLISVNNKSDTVEASEESVVRIQGDDRYGTASLISQESYVSADTVVIANAMNFVDALAGVPLAYQQEAPILLAYGNGLKQSTIAEINRLGASKAIILGGEAAISQEVEQKLTDLGLATDRIAGANRFDTASLIADELNKEVQSNKAVVVDGFEFADAMSIAPFAAREGMPIYLSKTNGLPNTDELDIYMDTYIVGGINAISYNVESQLNNPTRLFGSDRYETNVQVLSHFDVDANELFVSTGLNFADALTGSVLAANKDTGVALVKNGINDRLYSYIENQSFINYTILGGTTAVPQQAFNTLNNLLSNNKHTFLEKLIENEVTYQTIEEPANDLPVGESRVIQEGKNGYDVVSYNITTLNGTEVTREEIERRTIDPVPEIVEAGTKEIETIIETIQENKIDFKTITQENSELSDAEVIVIQEGRNGYDDVTYEVIYENGEEVDRFEISRETIAPIDEIVEVGITNDADNTDSIVSDSTAPIVENISLGKSSVSAGETIEINADVSDDLSGVYYAFVYVTSPNGNEESIRLSKGIDDRYRGTYTLNEYAESGIWKISKVSTQDNAGNFDYYYLDNREDLKFEVIN